MYYLTCENCSELIEKNHVDDHVDRDFDDPDFLTYSMRCDTCGEKNVIGRIPIDDHDFLGVDDVPFLQRARALER